MATSDSTQKAVKVEKNIIRIKGIYSDTFRVRISRDGCKYDHTFDELRDAVIYRDALKAGKHEPDILYEIKYGQPPKEMDSVDGRRKFVEDTRQRKLDQRNGIESPAEPTAAAIDSSFFQAAFTQFLQQMVGNVTQPLPTQLNRSVHTASQHIAGLPNWDQSQELTVGELIDQYKEEKLGIDPFTDDDILGSEAEYAGKKYNEARLAYLRFWKLEFGHMLVGDLSPDHINSAINRHASKKLPGSKKTREKNTLNRIIYTLSGVFTHAISKGRIAYNPVSGADKFKLKGREGQRTRIFGDEEKAAFLNECKNSRNPWIYCIALIAFETGVRLNPIQLLEWGWLDLRKGKAKIKFPVGVRKDDCPLSVPLFEEKLAVHELRRLRGIKKHARFVFSSLQGRDKPNYNRSAFELAFERSGINKSTKDEKLVFHSTRHHFATRFIEEGGEESVLITFTGHSPNSTAPRRYTNIREEKQRERGKKIITKFE